MAGIRRRGYDPVLCLTSARDGLHQINSAEDHRRRYQLALFERTQARAEGLAKGEETPYEDDANPTPISHYSLSGERVEPRWPSARARCRGRSRNDNRTSG